MVSSRRTGHRRYGGHRRRDLRGPVGRRLPRRRQLCKHGHDAADAFSTRTGIPVFAWDVADLAACAAGVERVQAALGPIDVLVNNAGITRDAMLHKMTAEQWREVVDVDLGGCFNMCRSVIEGMRERRFGRIVNISSVNALSGQVGQTNYAAAKPE
jgi:acetoacetyl-CoA reductase